VVTLLLNPASIPCRFGTPRQQGTHRFLLVEGESLPSWFAFLFLLSKRKPFYTLTFLSGRYVFLLLFCSHEAPTLDQRVSYTILWSFLDLVTTPTITQESLPFRLPEMFDRILVCSFDTPFWLQPPIFNMDLTRERVPGEFILVVVALPMPYLIPRAVVTVSL